MQACLFSPYPHQKPTIITPGSCRALDSPLVQPVITPRFVPTCSPELLARLGALARQHNCHVQSHISESLDNDAFVAQVHPEVPFQLQSAFNAILDNMNLRKVSSSLRS